MAVRDQSERGFVHSICPMGMLVFIRSISPELPSLRILVLPLPNPLFAVVRVDAAEEVDR